MPPVKIQIAAPPGKPVLIYDGDCRFCTRSAKRWERSAGGRIDFIPSRDPQVRQRFPEIPAREYELWVILIERDGKVYRGAEAVFRARAANGNGWLLWMYEKIPGFRSLSERGYRMIAERRHCRSKQSCPLP